MPLFFRSKLTFPTTNSQNLYCDNQERSLVYQCPTVDTSFLIPSSRIHSTDLMSNIQLLINGRLVKLFWTFSFTLLSLFLLKNSVQQSYRERIDELQDENKRKDLRIKLLEKKLQVSIIII